MAATTFRFTASDGREITAVPEAVTLNGRPGYIWTFFGLDFDDQARFYLGKTFMRDATRAEIAEQFYQMGEGCLVHIEITPES